MLELLLTINTIIFSSAPTWLKGKESKVNWTKTLPLLLPSFFFNMQLKEKDIVAEEAEWRGTDVAAAAAAAAATSWMYPTAVSYGFRVNNLVCLTMAALSLCRCPYPYPQPASTRLPPCSPPFPLIPALIVHVCYACQMLCWAAWQSD